MPTLLTIKDLDDLRIAISFPRNAEQFKALRELPGLRWSREHRAFIGGKDLRTVVPQHAVPGVKVVDRTTAVECNADLSGYNLFDYQREAVEFLIKNKSALLSSDPGTGKTRQEIAWADVMRGGGRVLVVYPSVARAVWRREIRNVVGDTLLELDGTTKRTMRAGGTLVSDALPEAVWVGVHYEILTAWTPLLRKVGFQVMTLDEIHFASNRKAQRTFSLFELAECIPHRSGGSGTLMRSATRNLWSICEVIRPGSMGGFWGSPGSKYAGQYCNYWNWAKRYCDAVPSEYGWDDSGASNIAELRERLGAMTIGHRREDVLDQLPEISRDVIEVRLSTKDSKHYYAAEKRLLPLAEAAKGTYQESIMDELVLTVEGMKAQAAVDLAYDAVMTGQKVVVLAHFHETLKIIEPLFKQAGVTLHMAPGWESPMQRQGAYEAFVAEAAGAVLLGNTLSTGVAVDMLSCASRLIFLSLEWLPADLVQAESRIVRIGQKARGVLVQYLVAVGTIDMRMATQCFGRVETAAALFGRSKHADGIAGDFQKAGMVDAHEVALTPQECEGEALDAVLAGMLVDFKTNKTRLKAGDAALVGGKETDWLLDEDEQ